MIKSSKLIWLVLVIFLLTFGLISCKSRNNEGDSNKPSNIDDEVIYSPYVNSTLVLGEGIESSDIIKLSNAYFKVVGKEIDIKTADDKPSSHEIIIGKTDRDISKKAYRNLFLFNNDENLVGFSVYTDGKSVAIAFDEARFGENVAFSEAIDYFVTNYIIDSSLKLKSGVIFLDKFDPIEKQQERDEEVLDRLWELKFSQISSKLYNEELATASLKELQNMYKLYNNDFNTVKWLANLYDPVTGGFYYSNSARNNEGFAPDLGSTSQALGLVEMILAGYGGSLTDYFGEDIVEKFVSFAKGMQDQNGYFYHPQWSKILIDNNPERKDIDVLNALNILDLFDVAPTYDTPNGVKGDGVVSVSNLTLPLRTTEIKAVSQIVADESNNIYIPTYMNSKEAFESYLSRLYIRSNTAQATKVLNSEIALYIAVDKVLEQSNEDYRLCDILATYLNKNQNLQTGLWSDANNIYYASVGNLVGIVNLYNTLEIPIPRYSTIMRSILNAMRFEKELDDISDISALWMALDGVVNNIKNYSDEIQKDDIAYYIGEVYSRFDTLLASTLKVLGSFLRDDGSFSTTINGSASEQYGMSVALFSMKEGDMNATLLASKNLWISIFGVLGVADIPIYTTSDRMMFQKTLFDMGVIIKNEVKKVEPKDFENGDIGEESNDVNLVTSGDTAERYAKIVAGPEKYGNVLKLYSSKEAGQDDFGFVSMSSVKQASCYYYELDMCVTEEFAQGFSAFIFMNNYAHMIAIERDGDTVKLIERSTQWDAAIITDTGARAKVGEWFKLRVEYYPESSDAVRVKIFFNNQCIAVTNSYAGKETANSVPSKTFKGMSILAFKKREMSLLVDNVVTESTYGTYIPESSSSVKINVDEFNNVQKKYDFEDMEVGSSPPDFESDIDNSALTVVNINNGERNNKLLSITEKAGKITLPIVKRGVDPNSVVLEFDITVSSDTKTGAIFRINFNEYLYKSRNFASMQFMVLEEDGNKYITFAEVLSGKVGTPNANTKLSLGNTHTLRLQLFYKEEALILSIDGELVAISGSVLKNCVKYYMGEVTFESVTPDISSTVYIDNLILEKLDDDFSNATKPNIERVEHTFDTTGGMEFSSIYPVNGILSFENAQKDSYIKIPVNKRVSAPTISTINFDVIKTDRDYGNTLIKFIDRDGNIIVALALVRSDNTITVHEYTKNGIYPIPLYSTEEEKFTLTVNYSEEIQGYNLLINSTFVTSSSLIYSVNSSEYEFEYLQIICGSFSAGLAIDNLYVEKICDILITSDSTNSDNSSKELTYEDSSFASLPNKIQTAFDPPNVTLSIKEHLFKNAVGDKAENSVSKVLDFYSNKTSGIIIFKKTQSAEGSNAAFFETYMMIESAGGYMKTLLQFRATISGTPTIYNFAFTTAGVGETVMLDTNDTDKSIDLGVKEGQWFKIRLEYTDTPCDFNYDDFNDCLTRVYVNDVFVTEGHKANNPSLVPSASDVTQMRVTLDSRNVGSVLFDDTALGQCNMEYEEPIPADKETITYTPGVITNKTQFTFGNKNVSYADITIENEVNKVLHFHTGSGSLDKLNIALTQLLDTANAISFETDIKILPASGTQVFYIEPVTAKGKQPFRLTIKATVGGNVTISASDIPETVIGKSGKWIHLKVEYMNPLLDYTGDRKADILYKIYADGAEKTLVGYQPYQSGAYYDPKDITKYVFTSPSESVADIYLDNTRFWQVELIPDEQPEFSENKDFSHGDSGTDLGAWT